MFAPRSLALAAVVFATAPLASAQTFNVGASPAAGTLAPRAGAVEALDFTLRGATESGRMDCPGLFEPAAPDAVVTWGGGALRLTVRSSADATLAVVDPAGRWHCNDDAEGLMPVVEIAGAAAGRYAVWAGTFGSPGVAATLLAGAPRPSAALAVSAAPVHTLQAAPGFGESARLDVAAGGLDAIPADLGLFCSGFVDAARPTARVTWAGGGRLSARLSSADTDAVLLVRTPDGRWLCDDDSGEGLDSALALDDAGAGDYLVWAASFRSMARAETLRGTLWFDEDEVVDDAGYDYDMPMRMPYSSGTYRTLDLTSSPRVRLDLRGDDPVYADLTVRPDGPNPVLGDACRGAIETAATALVSFDGTGPVGITAAGERDLVLLVQTPSGGWFCSDDADGLNPGIQLDEVERGAYRVWVGAFSNPDASETIAATLTLARGEITVSMPDYDFGMGGSTIGMGEPFAEGYYEGDDLTLGQPLTTLALTDTDAVVIEVTAAGSLLNPVAGPTCAGFVGARATAAVQVAGAGVRFTAESSDDDLVMVVRTPDGGWLCSDDAEGQSNPLVDVRGSGLYEVWVGTFSRRPNGARATLSALRL